MTTLNDLSVISGHVYGEPAEHPIPGWRLLLDSGETISGYRGIAFYHADSGDVIIGNRGTRPTNVKDILISDLAIALGLINEAEQAAADFAKTVLLHMELEQIPLNRLFVTGHSLGGVEAAYTAVNLTHLGIAIEAVTFNAPGLPSNALKPDVQYDIVDISATTDVIHRFGGLPPGKRLFVPVETPLPARLQNKEALRQFLNPISLIMNSLDAHRNAHFREFFERHRPLAEVDASDVSNLEQAHIDAHIDTTAAPAAHFPSVALDS